MPSPDVLDLSRSVYTREGVQKSLEAVPQLDREERGAQFESFLHPFFTEIEAQKREVLTQAREYSANKATEDNPDSSSLDQAERNYNRSVDKIITTLRTTYIQYKQEPVDMVLGELALKHLPHLRQTIVDAMVLKRPDDLIDHLALLLKEDIKPVLSRVKGVPYEKNPALEGKTEVPFLVKDQIKSAYIDAAVEGRTVAVAKASEYLYGEVEAHEREKRAARALDRIQGKLSALFFAFNDRNCMDPKSYKSQEKEVFLELVKAARDLSGQQSILRTDDIDHHLDSADRPWLRDGDALSEVRRLLNFYKVHGDGEVSEDQRRLMVKQWELTGLASHEYAGWLSVQAREILRFFPEEAVERVVAHLSTKATEGVRAEIGTRRAGLPVLSETNILAGVEERVTESTRAVQGMYGVVEGYVNGLDAKMQGIDTHLGNIDRAMPRLNLDDLADAIASKMPRPLTPVAAPAAPIDIFGELKEEAIAALMSLNTDAGERALVDALVARGKLKIDAQETVQALRENLLKRPVTAVSPTLIPDRPSFGRRALGGAARLAAFGAVFAGGVAAERAGLFEEDAVVVSEPVEEPTAPAAPMMWKPLGAYPLIDQQATNTTWLDSLPDARGRAIAVYCQDGAMNAPQGYPVVVWDLPHTSIKDGFIDWETDCQVRGFEALPQGQCLNQVCSIPVEGGGFYNGPLGVVLTPSNQ